MRLGTDNETGALGVILATDDKLAFDLIAAYAKRNRGRDPVNADLLLASLAKEGYVGPTPSTERLWQIMDSLTDVPDGAMGFVQQPVAPYKLDVVTLAMVGLRDFIELIQAAEAEKKRRLETGELS
jgi:hypothetical protein